MRRGFTLHHNGPPARCLSRPHTRCVGFWESVRAYHMVHNGWSDIAYSFGVCPHGVLFVGRGWDRPQFANGTDVIAPYEGRDAEWYTVLAFVGGDDSTKDTEPPTPEMVQRIKDLISQGRATGKCGLAVKPHSDFKPKPCPGPQLRGYARQWDGKPFGAETVQPPSQEIEDMFIYSTAEAPPRPVMFCHAGVSVGLNEASDLTTFVVNKMPHFKLDGDTYDAFLRSYPRV